MKTKLFAGIALAGALLMGGPVFADGGQGGRGAVASRGYASGRTAGYGYAGRGSVAFGGSSRYYGAATGGWNVNRAYNWNGRRYRYYNNAWYPIDAFTYYPGYGYYIPGYGYENGYVNDSTYDSGDSLSAQVQSALYQLGYYRGPIDGIQGPRTQAAIAAYQRDHGLPETGVVSGGLIAALGIQ